MGSRLVIVTVMLMFALGLLSSCDQNPSAEGVDASAAKQGNAEQPSEEPTLVEETSPMPEATMTTASATAASDVAILAGGKPPPEYQVMKDGTLIIEGDMLVRCADLLQFRRNYFEGLNPTPEARRQMRQAHNEQVRVCTRAGFPPDKPPQSP